MRTTRTPIVLTAALATLLLAGCASFKSDLQSAYEGEAKRNPDPRPVSVVFVFSHVRQTVGLDAVPKLVSKRLEVPSFDEVFGDALPELSNLGRYDTFTDEANDVNQPERRAVRDSLMRVSDYTVKIRIEATKPFARHFLGGIVSTLSATAVPVPYAHDYRLKADVLGRDRTLLASYERRASLTRWVEALLVFAYPFFPEERLREEIYMEFLHDTFRQMESEGVLKATG